MKVESQELKGKEILEFLESVLDICKLDCRTTFHAECRRFSKRVNQLKQVL